MTGRRSAFVTPLALLFAATGLLRPAAQGPASGADATGPGATAAVTVRVTAVVRDARGRPVLDLKPGDFSLDDNGVPQTLTSVELRAVARTAAAPTAAPIVSADDEAAAAREPGTRLFALFLDEFNIAPGEHSARIREAAQRFVTSELRPADLLCVLKPLGSVTAIRFTRDRAAALATIASFEGRKGDYEPRTDFERQFFGRTPAAVEGARAQIVATALRELTLRIGELQSARAALVLASEGLARTPGDSRRLPGWQALARAASHFNLPVYPLDPRDPEPAATAPDDPPADPSPESRRGPSRGARERRLTLPALAAQTGGEAFAGPAVAGAFSRIARDLDAYYLLTYSPSAPTDGRFHPLVVRTARKAVEVRTPTGYWSPLSEEWRTWLNRPTTPVATVPGRAMRRSPLIDMWYGLERDADGGLRMVVTWQPSALADRPRAPRPAQVALKAGMAEGGESFEQNVAPVATDSADGAARATFPVTAGRVQLDLEITTMDGTVIDHAAQDIDVPRTRGNGPVLLQPQLMRARTARDVEALAQTATVTPSPSRAYRRTERLLLRVPAYSPDGAAVTVTASLVNTRGQTIRRLGALPASPATGAAQFDVPLAFLAPADYGLEIRVDGPGGTARQLLRFELTG